MTLTSAQYEWIEKLVDDGLVITAGIAKDLVARIRFLEARQTELQARGTELVEENRRLKKIEITVNEYLQEDEEEPYLFGNNIRTAIKIFKRVFGKGE
jgi:hypothetical protein